MTALGSRADRTPIYGRPSKCRVCGSREVMLFAIDDQAKLDAVQRALWAAAASSPRR